MRVLCLCLLLTSFVFSFVNCIEITGYSQNDKEDNWKINNDKLKKTYLSYENVKGKTNIDFPDTLEKAIRENKNNSTNSRSGTTTVNPIYTTEINISRSNDTTITRGSTTLISRTTSSTDTTKSTPTSTTTRKIPSTKRHPDVTSSSVSSSWTRSTRPVSLTTPRINASDPVNRTRPTAKAKSGTYLGYWSVTSEGVHYASFSGIRYVKQMTPLNRFQWAELVDDSDRVIEATKEGPDCPQWNIHRKSNDIVGEEDCLFMNIYTPKVEGKYPVMVVLACGHFVFDSASRYLNGPDYFMNTQKMVMVIFNYRLGPLGYADFRSDKYPSNLGMKDQVLALQWVQKNIAAFGGDPERVTLQGTSSGAVSVHYHMISPLSKGLFHAGISESGTALDPWSTVYPHRSRGLLISLAAKTNCEWAVPVDLSASADTLAECFRNRSVYQLLAATRRFNLDLVQMLFMPVIEVSKKKPFIAVDPFLAPEHPVPWLSGQNSDEAGIITFLEKPIFWLARLYISSIDYQAIPFWLNYAETAKDPWNVTSTIMYHYAKTYAPTQSNIVPLFKKAGEDGIFWNPHYLSLLKHKAPRYSYLFKYRQTTKDGAYLHPDRGVTHSEEQFYLFIKQGVDIQNQNPPADVAVSKTLVRLWTNFVVHHDPTPTEEKTVPKWERWTEENNLLFTIGQNSTKMAVDPKLEAYEFWRNLPYRDKMPPFPYYPHINGGNSSRHHWRFIKRRRQDTSLASPQSPLHLLTLLCILLTNFIFTML